MPEDGAFPDRCQLDTPDYGHCSHVEVHAERERDNQLSADVDRSVCFRKKVICVQLFQNFIALPFCWHAFCYIV